MNGERQQLRELQRNHFHFACRYSETFLLPKRNQHSLYYLSTGMSIYMEKRKSKLHKQGERSRYQLRQSLLQMLELKLEKEILEYYAMLDRNDAALY
jgi:hypothetical protein